jgi:hypothetical protein
MTDTQFIGMLPLSLMSQADGLVRYSDIGTLPLSPMSQAVGLSYIQTASLRQHNWGHRPQIGAQLRGHRPVIVTHAYTRYDEGTTLASR